MDADSARSLLLALPHVVETMQWGDNLVFWVGDKAIGGKMFALVDLGGGLLGGGGRARISFAAGAERAAELLERDGFFPAPYLARAHWVAAERWQALRSSEWEEHLRHAYALTFAKLPARTRATFALPRAEQERMIQERQSEQQRPARHGSSADGGPKTRVRRAPTKRVARPAAE